MIWDALIYPTYALDFSREISGKGPLDSILETVMNRFPEFAEPWIRVL
jgi:hypothetical protein